MTVRGGEWKRSKLHGGSARGARLSVTSPIVMMLQLKGASGDVSGGERIKYSFLGNH